MAEGWRRLRAKVPWAVVTAVLIVALANRRTLGFYWHFTRFYLAGPPPAAQCADGPGFKYCAYGAPRGVHDDPGSMLYFIHFAGGSEKSWLEVPISRVYYAEFRRRGRPAPRVVAVSFGKHWNLFDKPGAKSAVLFGEFTGKVMPWIEGRLGKPKKRYLWGLSQGAMNGASLVLKRPGLWSGAVLSCPAFLTLSPFETGPELRDYVKRNGARLTKVEWIQGLIRDRIAGPEEWPREDPLSLAKTARRLPPLLVDCTDKDEYGFYEGARRFAETLKARGEPVTWLPEKGGHCELDARGAASFLAGLAGR